MATIGTFTRSGDTFNGTVKTVMFKAKVTIRPVDKTSDKAPDYRIAAEGSVDLGAGWKKTSKEDRPYVSVKLDDPSFANPIYATLVEGEEPNTFNLIWSRNGG